MRSMTATSVVRLAAFLLVSFAHVPRIFALPICSVLIPEDGVDIPPSVVLKELQRVLLLEDVDGVTLFGTGVEVRSVMPDSADSGIMPPDVPEGPDWESQFAWGVYHSQVSLGEEEVVHSWTFDAKASEGAVPAKMLRAEELLQHAANKAPEQQKKAKMAEQSLRMYYHAKWLAERNYAKAAEWRYREAARLAKQCRRSVLASHALSRLGYFLMHWRRFDEAREILQESERMNKKSNPLGPYLFGVLERQMAGADEQRLVAAEQRILSAGEQASEELDAERKQLVQEISYWREAVSSPRNCLNTGDATHALICLCSHSGLAVKQQLFR